MGMINVLKAPWGKKDGSQVTWALKRGVADERLSLMSQPRPGCATKQTKTKLTGAEAPSNNSVWAQGQRTID